MASVWCPGELRMWDAGRRRLVRAGAVRATGQPLNSDRSIPGSRGRPRGLHRPLTRAALGSPGASWRPACSGSAVEAARSGATGAGPDSGPKVRPWPWHDGVVPRPGSRMHAGRFRGSSPASPPRRAAMNTEPPVLNLLGWRSLRPPRGWILCRSCAVSVTRSSDRGAPSPALRPVARPRKRFLRSAQERPIPAGRTSTMRSSFQGWPVCDHRGRPQTGPPP